MFRNAPQGGSTGISMSVGPSPINGAQNAFPIDVVPYGGLYEAIVPTTNGVWVPSGLTVPAGLYVRLHSMCDAELLQAAAGSYDAVSSAAGTFGAAAVITQARPFALLGGMLFEPADLYFLNESPPSTLVTITYDLVLIPSIT